MKVCSPEGRGRRGQENIVRQQMRPTRIAQTEDILESFLLFVTEDMLLSIVTHTNEYANDVIALQEPGSWYEERWKDVDLDEMKAFVACLIFAGVTKSQHESLEQMWSTDAGRCFFRATMSLRRFIVIMKFLRFDSKRDGVDRRE